MSRRRILIGVAVALAAVAVIVVVASLSGLVPIDLGLGVAGGGSRFGTEEGSALETTGSAKADTGTRQSATNDDTQSATSGSSSTGGSGSADSGTTSAGGGSRPSSPKSPAPPIKPGETVEFKILWWNETAEKSPGGFEVVFGSSSVKPDASKRSGSGTLSGSVVGKEQTLTVYPDGRSGRKFEVSFTHTAGMAPLTETDAIHVEVSDGKVRVLGNPIDNFDHVFDRF